MAAIPQTDPRANYLAHKEAIDGAVARVLESGRYILGREVAAFEEEFAGYLGAKHAVGVASGTDALHLALRSCGIGPGDLVLTVSHTAVATAAAIDLCGASPVFVDVDPDSFTMDPGRLEDAVKGFTGGRLKAVVPVHLYGHPADMTAVAGIAKRYGLRVVEDCAQSHGATWRGRKTGTLGHIAAFSFYPTKNLGALGDGGMVVTDDGDLAERTRLLREYGWKERYVSTVPGLNSRLDELQAAVLRVKLPHLDAENECRRTISATYSTLLGDSGVILPKARPAAGHVYHQYVIRTPRRDALKTRLREKGIGTLVHYPVPVHRQPAYAGRMRETKPLPRTDEIAGQVLSLPVFPELHVDQARQVAREIMAWSGTEGSPR
jgi:dTDP-4-amino-4,6-dideoxygalactose transaminase